MEYRAVANRCAVALDDLHLPISNREIITILESAGFTVVDVNIIALARECIGVSKYRRGARLNEAPGVFDCSSFIKWLYACRGVWLPRRSIQQREIGEIINFGELIAGDVVFVSGYINYYFDNPVDGVGHVGIYTGDGTIIHAANSKIKIVESSIDEFVCDSKLRGARRYIPKDIEVLTLETPIHRDVETADDIKWIVLQSLNS